MKIVEPISEADIATLIARCEAADSPQTYALVDCAFDPTLLNRLPGREHVAVYKDTDFDGLGELSPALIPIGTAHLSRDIPRLLGERQQQPMLSFILSECSLDQLKRQLAYLLKIDTEDGTSWPMRFADTRITQSLFGVLKPEQKDMLMRPLHSWIIPTRQGTLQTEKGANEPRAIWNPDRHAKLKLDDTQFATMLDDAEPDNVISALEPIYPVLMEEHAPAQRFELVRWSVQESNKLKIETPLHRAHMALCALSVGPKLADMPQYSRFCETVLRGEPFEQAVSTLSQSI